MTYPALLKTVRLISVLSICLSSCCEDCDLADEPAPCTSKDDMRNVSFNAFDRNPTSDYYGKVVAVFSLQQQSTSYSGLGCGSNLMECSNTLSVRNVTNKTISFDFDIKYSLNLASWNYQNFAVIAPNSSYDFGTINSNCASVSLGNIQLSGSAISYQ